MFCRISRALPYFNISLNYRITSFHRRYLYYKKIYKAPPFDENMKNTKNIATKCLLLMKIQAACFGVDLDKENIIYSKKRLDDPKFIDFLTEDKIDNCETLPNENYPQLIQNSYETPISSSEQKAYKINKDGTTEQISGSKNKQSVKDYITQKFIAIQALKDQIDAKEEVNQFYNKN